jgi:hypothetical protein
MQVAQLGQYLSWQMSCHMLFNAPPDTAAIPALRLKQALLSAAESPIAEPIALAECTVSHSLPAVQANCLARFGLPRQFLPDTLCAAAVVNVP